MQKLLELKMIEPVGRKDAVGRPVLFGTTDEFLKRFQISSLDDLPDYEELLTKIREIHGETETQDYLYHKPTYVDETAVTETAEEKAEEVKTTNIVPDDFDLPSIEDEEIPDFLSGEEVNKIQGE